MDGGSRKIRRVLLFINPRKNDAGNLAEQIRKTLEGRGIEVRSCSPEDAGGSAVSFPPEDRYDLAFSLGGDGTVLGAARAMAPLGVPIIPVNLGTLGFIAEVPPGDWSAVLDQVIAGTAGVSRRLMLEAVVERGNKTIKTASCLNETVISSSGIAKLVRLQVRLETLSPGGFIRLGQYRSDGLIAATPTGSTAYSMAAGGPILDPELEALIINPVCPFTLSHRSLVLPSTEPVIIEIEAEQRSGVLLTLDGQETETLEPGDRIRIRRAPWQALLVYSERNVFYRALSAKLNWSGVYQNEGGGSRDGVSHA
ncbi:MAG: NAD(+)/NADH kinase [Treponema sp.]|jgi:NAD+ kinase|nr:NAD(+)/NADH kinase [Treponema sp.]